MGVDKDGNGIGEPVLTYKKPNVGQKYPINTPQESDEFNESKLGLQWQWNANSKSNFCFPAGKSYGFLRLYNVPVPENTTNFWNVPNLLTQKFPAPDFTSTTKFTFTPRTDDEETGLIISGIDYAYISVKKTANGLVVSQTKCINAENGAAEKKLNEVSVKSETLYFKVTVRNILPNTADYKTYNIAENSLYGNALCTFSYSEDGKIFTTIGEPFAAKKGKWVGSTVGIFAIRHGKTYETGYADYDWFRVDK